MYTINNMYPKQIKFIELDWIKEEAHVPQIFHGPGQ